MVCKEQAIEDTIFQMQKLLDHNVMIDVKNFFDQPVKNKMANLDMAGNTRIYFILEEAKETVLDFSQGTVKVLQNAIE